MSDATENLHTLNASHARAFNYLWTAVTVSLFGTLISRVAIPYIAILTLRASDAQVAWLNMAEVVAGVVSGLFLGTWVDRASRKHMLVVADLARAVLLLAIPILWWRGNLHMAWLIGIAFTVGLNTQLFTAAYNAYLPGVIPKDDLLKSNAKVRGATAIAEAGSFSLGGVIVGIFGPPLAILIDIVSYLVSALLILRVPYVAPSAAIASTLSPLKTFLHQTLAGLRWVNTQRSLKNLLLCAASMACWGQMMGVVYMLFVARDLALPPTILGVLFAAGGASSLFAVIVVTKLSRRVHYGRILVCGIIAAFVGLLCLILAPASNVWMAATAIVLQQLILDGGFAAFSLVEQTCKQTLAPNELLGRVNGVAQCLQSIGQIVGGTIAALSVAMLGSRGVLIVALSGIALSAIYAWRTGLSNLQVDAATQLIPARVAKS